MLVRVPENPILTANDFPTRLRAVYNSAAITTAEGKDVMLCRTNQLSHQTLLWGADSTDGMRWALRPEPFHMPADELWEPASPIGST